MTSPLRLPFLLEIGTEELPAAYIPSAVEQLEQALLAALAEARLTHSAQVRRFATPRRLALWISALDTQQAPRKVEVKGPSRKAAFDEEGRPTKAALGFAKAQGVPVEDLRVRSTEQGEYVFAVRSEPSRPAVAVLQQLLPDLIRRLAFPKSMRWGYGEMRFARPIRWLVALLGDEVIPFAVEEVASERYTQGHRLSPGGERVKLATADEYEAALLEHRVLADPEARRRRVEEQVRMAAARNGGEAVLEEELLDEVSYLVEYPMAVCGRFDPGYLELPEPVLVTPMKEHQRYFPVKAGDGRLAPMFVAVANNPDPGAANAIRTGNERVLAARLADARFFFEEDLKRSLEDRLGELEGIAFIEPLGTLADKRVRLEALVRWIASAAGLDEGATARAVRAARLAKADLATHMVYEFPELQGVMGREYALRSGEDPRVAEAIFEHYLPRGAGDRLPASEEGAALSVADKLDTLVGCFGAGLIPTGSQDPYGLRRQALGVVHIALDRGWRWPILSGLQVAIAGYGDRLAGTSAADLAAQVLSFIQQRARGVLVEQGLRWDLVEAAADAAQGVLLGWVERARALAELVSSTAFAEAVVAFQRAANLASRAEGSSQGLLSIDEELLREEAERSLAQAVKEAEGRVAEQVAGGDFRGAIQTLAALKPAVDRFFDEVLVMAEDPELRRNRLAILRRLVGIFERVADFSRIQPA